MTGTGNTDTASRAVLLGRITGLYGVKGWVKVFSYTDPREAILTFDRWLLGSETDWKSVSVADGRQHGKAVIARISGIDDRDAAAALVGRDIAVHREDLPAVEDGQFYWTDLEGLDVVTRGGRSLGRVAYLLETGAHDVLVTAGDRERLIPFVMDEVILDVDIARRVIRVDWDWE